MDTRKIVQALAYFAYNQPNHIIDCMKAYKLIWLADRYQLRYSGRMISGDTYYAMPFGPVPSDAKNIIDGIKTNLENDASYVNKYIKVLDKKYQAISAPDLKVFSISDKEAMDKVLEHFNHMSYTKLSTFSHRFPEWKKYENALKDSKQPNSIKIEIDYFFEDNNDCLIDDFFADDKETLELSREMYHLQNHN